MERLRPNAKAFTGPDPRWPVTVHQMGRSIFDPIWAEQQHTDPRSELIHVLRGRVRIETPTYTISGQAGDTLYTPAQMPHKDVFPPNTIFQVYLVQFEWAEEQAVLERFHPRELAHHSSESQMMLDHAFDRLYREFAMELPFQRSMVTLHTAEILYQLCRAAEMRGLAGGQSPDRITNDRRRQIMNEAQHLIETWLDQPISLDALAEVIDVSPYYLSRVFSQESGFTLSTYLTQRRMERASQLLTQTNRPIKTVAYEVGYRDSHYFSRVFRNLFNLSPSTYRRQARAKDAR